VDLDAVAAGIQVLNVDLLAVQEVDRTLADSGRADQPALIAQALGVGWFRSYAPALVGDDFRPLAGPDPGGPAYGNLLVSRLPLAEVEQLRFPPTGAASSAPRCWPASRSACARLRWRPPTLSNKRGHNLRQLRELQQLAGSRMAPRLLVGDLNLPSTVVVASRRGWPEIGGRTWPNSHPDPAAGPRPVEQPGGVVRPRGATRLS
jgi:endonuclease/exonuclease/phosphatase family metal-dependent hydrolase